MAERFFEDKTNEYGYTVKVVKPHNLLHNRLIKIWCLRREL